MNNVKIILLLLIILTACHPKPKDKENAREYFTLSDANFVASTSFSNMPYASNETFEILGNTSKLLRYCFEVGDNSYIFLSSKNLEELLDISSLQITNMSYYPEIIKEGKRLYGTFRLKDSYCLLLATNKKPDYNLFKADLLAFYSSQEEDGISPYLLAILYEHKGQDIYYSFLDIDGDDKKELLLASAEEEDQPISAIFFLDGMNIHAIKGSGNNHYHLLENGQLLEECINEDKTTYHQWAIKDNTLIEVPYSNEQFLAIELKSLDEQ